MYSNMRKAGFEIIFKETSGGDNYIKGNVDAELVLHTMLELDNFDQAIIVSGDGDFYCLAAYLKSIGKLKKVLVPNQNKYSQLLNKLNNEEYLFLDYLNKEKRKLEYLK